MIKFENCIIVAAVALAAFASARAEWRLKWSDEFEADGRPDPAKWGYERGYVRNREWQYYQEENAFCSNGWLVIEARRDPERNYTSACVNTSGKKSFGYGKIEIRAKIKAQKTLWPALWMLGDDDRWPLGGEIDIMEYYGDRVHANFCWGVESSTSSGDWSQTWNSQSVKMPDLKAADPDWEAKWHVWTIVRTEKLVTISLDGVELNRQVCADARNPSYAVRKYAFRRPMYLMMNLAIKDHNGDSAVEPQFPSQYLVDYVRFYEDVGPSPAPGQDPEPPAGSASSALRSNERGPRALDPPERHLVKSCQ